MHITEVSSFTYATGHFVELLAILGFLVLYLLLQTLLCITEGDLLQQLVNTFLR